MWSPAGSLNETDSGVDAIIARERRLQRLDAASNSAGSLQRLLGPLRNPQLRRDEQDANELANLVAALDDDRMRQQLLLRRQEPIDNFSSHGLPLQQQIELLLQERELSSSGIFPSRSERVLSSAEATAASLLLQRERQEQQLRERQELLSQLVASQQEQEQASASLLSVLATREKEENGPSTATRSRTAAQPRSYNTDCSDSTLSQLLSTSALPERTGAPLVGLRRLAGAAAQTKSAAPLASTNSNKKFARNLDVGGIKSTSAAAPAAMKCAYNETTDNSDDSSSLEDNDRTHDKDGEQGEINLKQERSDEIVGNDNSTSCSSSNNVGADDHNVLNFPHKLHRLLSQAEEDGHDDIISFSRDGHSFVIHKMEDFTSVIMPKYFASARVSSFKRQLNLYGFKRILDAPEKESYRHRFFVKGEISFCKKIKRRKVRSYSPPRAYARLNGQGSGLISRFLTAGEESGAHATAAAPGTFGSLGQLNSGSVAGNRGSGQQASESFFSVLMAAQQQKECAGAAMDSVGFRLG